LLDRVAVHLHHPQHRLAVGGEALEGAHRPGQLGARAVGRAMEDCRQGAAQAAAGVAVVGQPVGHQQAAEVRVAEPQRPVEVAVAGDPGRRIAGVIDQDLLGDEEHAAGCGEPLDVEGAVGPAELHQIDARQVAGRVVQEHVFAAGIAGVDPAGVGAGVPAVDRRVVLHARVAALPGALGHPVEHLAGLVARAGLGGVGHPPGGPAVVAIDRLHELIAQADGEVGVLEQDRAVGLAVEVGVVAPLLDQHPGLLLFLALALDEIHDVGVVDLERLHLGRPPGLAAALHHGRHLVVDPHEGEGARGLAAAGELLPLAADRGEVGAGTRTELEEHRLAAGEVHDVFHVVFDALDEAGAPLGILIRVVGHHDVPLGLVPPPVAGGPLHAVLVEQADIEPDRRVEGPVLVDAQPGQVTIEVFAVLLGLEVAVGQAPVGDRAGHAVDELLDGVLPLGRVDLAIEILADHHVGGQLAPGGRDFTGRLLEEHLAVLPLDCGGAEFPFGRVERTVHLGRAEGGADFEGGAAGTPRGGGGAGGGAGAGERGRVEICHGKGLLVKTGKAMRETDFWPPAESILAYSSVTTCIDPRPGPHELFSPGERPSNRKNQKAGPSACYRNMLWWSIR
jgi:hypothetical protein